MPLFGPPDIDRLKERENVKGLIKALNYGSDYRIRRDAAKALGAIGDIHAAEPLITALNDDHSSVKWAVAMALGQIGEARAVEPLIDILNNKNYQVRKAAAMALGQIGDARAVEPLISALGERKLWDKDHVGAEKAFIKALVQINTPAVDFLIAALDDENWHVRYHAAEVLGKIGDPRAVELLICALNNKLGSAAKALGQIGDARALKPLIAALEDKDFSVRKNIVAALDTLDWQPDNEKDYPAYWVAKGEWSKCIQIGEPAVKPLIVNLKAHNKLVRFHTVKTLGQIGSARTVEPLTTALNDKDTSVCNAAARALGRIGDSRAVEPLIVILKNDIGGQSWFAAEALGQIGDIRAVEPLIAALESALEHVRVFAARALGQIGDVRAVEPLIIILWDYYGDECQSAAEALGQIGDARAVEPLITALRDKSEPARASSARALGQIGDPRAVEPLIDILENEEGAIRTSAIEALGQIGDPRAIEPLLAMLGYKMESTHQIRKSTAIALFQIFKSGKVEQQHKQLILNHRSQITKKHEDEIKNHTDIDHSKGGKCAAGHEDRGDHIDHGIGIDFPL